MIKSHLLYLAELTARYFQQRRDYYNYPVAKINIRFQEKDNCL